MNLISVIVTTYNWPAALKLCLESLFAQQDKNFEIIIGDDASMEQLSIFNYQFSIFIECSNVSLMHWVIY